MTPLSTAAEGAAGAISRLWYARNPAGWERALELARAHGMTLLDVIGGTYREVRDEVARAAFDAQADAGVVAWVQRAEVSRERRDAERNRPVIDFIGDLSRATAQENLAPISVCDGGPA